MRDQIETRETSKVVECFERPDVLELDWGVPDCWYVTVKETYSGDHPDFHTERLVLDVHNEGETEEIVIDLTPRQLLGLGLAFTRAAVDLMDDITDQNARRVLRMTGD